jgi:hypothetical protein
MKINTNQLRTTLDLAAHQPTSTSNTGKLANLVLKNVYIGSKGDVHVSKSGWSRMWAGLMGRATGRDALMAGMAKLGVPERTAKLAVCLMNLKDTNLTGAVRGVSRMQQQANMQDLFHGQPKAPQEPRAKIHEEAKPTGFKPNVEDQELEFVDPDEIITDYRRDLGVGDEEDADAVRDARQRNDLGVISNAGLAGIEPEVKPKSDHQTG